MGRGGLEPPTHGFSVRCSTNWATCPNCRSHKHLPKSEISALCKITISTTTHLSVFQTANWVCTLANRKGLSRQNFLKLRGFLVSFSAANPYGARNTYLLLQLRLPTNGMRETQLYPVTVGSDKPSDRKYSGVLRQTSLNKSSPTLPTKPIDKSQTIEMFVSFQD